MHIHNLCSRFPPAVRKDHIQRVQDACEKLMVIKEYLEVQIYIFFLTYS